MIQAPTERFVFHVHWFLGFSFLVPRAHYISNEQFSNAFLNPRSLPPPPTLNSRLKPKGGLCLQVFEVHVLSFSFQLLTHSPDRSPLQRCPISVSDSPIFQCYSGRDTVACQKASICFCDPQLTLTIKSCELHLKTDGPHCEY